MKKTFSMLLAALMIAGTAAAVTAADGEVVNLAEGANFISCDVAPIEGSAASAFDGDFGTWCYFDGAGGEDCWIGIELSTPAILSHVSLASWDSDGDGITDRFHALHGTIVCGSNDGENWDTIMQFGDPYYEYEDFHFMHEDDGIQFWTEYAFDGESDEDDDMTDPVPYKYYKVWNNTDGIPLYGEVEFWGTFVEEETPDEPEDPDYIVGDLNGDEAIDIADAVLLFQHSMVPDLYPIDYAGDVDFNKDGMVDIADAVLLFQHSMVPDLYPIG